MSSCLRPARIPLRCLTHTAQRHAAPAPPLASTGSIAISRPAAWRCSKRATFSSAAAAAQSDVRFPSFINTDSSSSNSSSSSTSQYADRTSAVQQQQALKPININGIKANGKTTRFYNQVSIVKVTDLPDSSYYDVSQVACPDGYALQLAGRLLTTPSEQLFTMPNQMLAYAIAHEWDCQLTRIVPDTMPLTHTAMIANDQARLDREFIVNGILGRLKFDSTCVRATQPPPLVRLQRKTFDGLHADMQQHWHPGVPLPQQQPATATGKKPAPAPQSPYHSTSGIMTPQQPAELYDAADYLLQQQSSWGLACLDALTSVSKSFVIGWLAYTDKLDSIDDIFEAARLEEQYQLRHYGQISGAFGHNVEIAYVRNKIAAIKTMIAFLDLEPETHTKPYRGSDEAVIDAETGQPIPAAVEVA